MKGNPSHIEDIYAIKYLRHYGVNKDVSCNPSGHFKINDNGIYRA